MKSKIIFASLSLLFVLAFFGGSDAFAEPEPIAKCGAFDLMKSEHQYYLENSGTGEKQLLTFVKRSIETGNAIYVNESVGRVVQINYDHIFTYIVDKRRNTSKVITCIGYEVTGDN